MKEKMKRRRVKVVMWWMKFLEDEEKKGVGNGGEMGGLGWEKDS